MVGASDSNGKENVESLRNSLPLVWRIADSSLQHWSCDQLKTPDLSLWRSQELLPSHTYVHSKYSKCGCTQLRPCLQVVQAPPKTVRKLVEKIQKWVPGSSVSEAGEEGARGSQGRRRSNDWVQQQDKAGLGVGVSCFPFLWEWWLCPGGESEDSPWVTDQTSAMCLFIG